MNCPENRVRLRLEQVQVADELGFSNVWVVEHHFMEGLSHLSGA